MPTCLQKENLIWLCTVQVPLGATNTDQGVVVGIADKICAQGKQNPNSYTLSNIISLTVQNFSSIKQFICLQIRTFANRFGRAS